MNTQNQAEQLPIESKGHYTYQVQLLVEAFNNGELPEVERITIEPSYGYMASIHYSDSRTRVIYGHDPGFNPASSDQLAKDKGYSKFILRSLDINCPNGDEFLLPWWAETLKQSNRNIENTDIKTVDAAYDYIIQSLAYPVYIKPVNGSQSIGVTKVYDALETHDVFETYEQERVKVALVEEALNLPDYRLLVFDGQLVNAYERRPFSVTGDGKLTVDNLIEIADDEFKEQGRNIAIDSLMPQIVKVLGRNSLTLASVLKENQIMRLVDVSNLSSGGVPYDVLPSVSERWIQLANKIADGFNLRMCGIDLACQDITSSDSEYSVIEVNSSPGAKHFMASTEEGRDKLKRLFIKLFRISH